MYTHLPSFTDVNFFYRGTMVQSWNKFCYQGGMLEVRAQLPRATSCKSGNPDIALGKAGKVANNKFYPTWPGIWMLGNLGRVISPLRRTAYGRTRMMNAMPTCLTRVSNGSVRVTTIQATV